MNEVPSVDVLLGWVRTGDARLREELGSVTDEQVAEPTLLPGWTRGHILTHLARNADGLTNLLTWARTGVETPMYASSDQRRVDIEAGAGRGIGALRQDVERTSARLLDAAAALTPEQWNASVRTHSVPALTASQVPWLRTREVWIHLVDLDIGVGFDAVPEEVTRALLQDVAASMHPRVDVPVTLVVSGAIEGPVALGHSDGGEPIQVEGATCDLVAWLIGRSEGRGLQVAGGGSLPQPPRWI
jgi:maleylpyruvate isomerase